jgi:carbon monoxide dehydrogenase subunit G
MKILKNILAVLAVLLIGFILVGIFKPSIDYSSEIEVNKPIKEAWAVMNDESKISQWLKGITNIEHVSGEKGAVGAVTKYTFDENGQESTILETLKTMRPNEQVAMDFTMEGVMTMDYKVDFVEKNGKTYIKSSTITKGDGIIMRSMIPFMKSTMQAQEDENLNNLKKLIEENTTDYFPAPVVESVEELEEDASQK